MENKKRKEYDGNTIEDIGDDKLKRRRRWCSLRIKKKEKGKTAVEAIVDGNTYLPFIIK